MAPLAWTWAYWSVKWLSSSRIVVRTWIHGSVRKANCCMGYEIPSTCEGPLSPGFIQVHEVYGFLSPFPSQSLLFPFLFPSHNKK